MPRIGGNVCERPCRMTRDSSFCPVVCQPTPAPGFNLTNPLRIPAVWGAPRSNGQSTPGHSNARAIGFGPGACETSGSPSESSRRQNNVVRENETCFIGIFSSETADARRSLAPGRLFLRAGDREHPQRSDRSFLLNTGFKAAPCQSPQTRHRLSADGHIAAHSREGLEVANSSHSPCPSKVPS